MIQCSAMQYTV